MTNPFPHPSTLVIALVVACAAGCATKPLAPTAHEQCSPSAATNRAVVLSFYQMGFIDQRPRDAFERYASADMVEHKPDVPLGTRAAVANYLEQLIGALPKAKWEMLRAASEADLVFLHARFTAEPGSQSYAVADVFRLENCKIVEHWDVVAAPRDGQPNPNPRF